MKKNECEHFVTSIVYLVEQTSIYFNTKGEEYFKTLNIGVSLDEFIALDTVSFNQGICQRDLSKLILKDRSYTSRILDTLEKKKFIERRNETKGKRLVKKLYMTSEGEKIILGNQDRLRKSFEQVFGDFSEEEFMQARAILEKMKHNISKFTVIQI